MCAEAHSASFIGVLGRTPLFIYGVSLLPSHKKPQGLHFSAE
jgi:hypothetical protein